MQKTCDGRVRRLNEFGPLVKLIFDRLLDRVSCMNDALVVRNKHSREVIAGLFPVDTKYGTMVRPRRIELDSLLRLENLQVKPFGSEVRFRVSCHALL